MLTDLEKQAAYIKLVSAACPEITLHSVKWHVHDGELNDILIGNGELIFRFPRHSGNVPGFVQEIRLLRKLHPYVPLPIPQLIYDSGSESEPAKVFMGYRLIPGRPLTREALDGFDGETIRGMARQLAGFLTALHRLDANSVGVDLPELNMPAWARSFFTEVQNHLFSYMRPEACKAVTDNFERYFAQEDLHLYQCSLIHSDFGGSNILYEGSTISGVLDFTGACLSDPAVDIASVSTYGERFFEHICRFYPVDGSMTRRAEFYRSLFALEEAMYGWKNDDEEAFGRGMEGYI